MRLTRIDRYVWRELAATTLATAVVLLMVMFSGVLADLFGKISRGRLPPGLLLSQLGLRSVDMLPLVLPLALFLGVLLGLGRMYRDSEMSVLASVGVGIRVAQSRSGVGAAAGAAGWRDFTLAGTCGAEAVGSDDRRSQSIIAGSRS